MRKKTLLTLIVATSWICALAEVDSNVSFLACPEIELPSISGNKANFRYIDAGCDESYTIRPSFGVSGGQISGYTVQSIPYDPPFAFTQGTSIFINQDDVWGNVINLPFSFCFFNNTYKKAVVGANGLISFNTNVANTASGWKTSNLPSVPSTQYATYDWTNAIYGVFEDINPRQITSQKTGGSIKYGILGQEPCRTLTVSWYNVPLFDTQGKIYWNSYQIVLYEGTNVIDVYVLHRARTSWNNGNGIIGLQNANGTQGITAPNRNNKNKWAADKEGWRFTPKSSPQYTITYYRGKGINGTILGTGEQLTINPKQEEYITARLQFTAANGANFDLRDTALIIHSAPKSIVTNKEICQGQSFDWYGKTYSKTGTYEYSVSDPNECGKKTYVLNLIVNSGMHKVEKQSICSNNSFAWHNKTYSESGTYYDTHKSIAGCDSSYVLELAIGKSYHFVEKVQRCEGETYTWRGKTYSKGGKYYDKYTAHSGCDSIYELQLSIPKPYLFSTKAKICPNSIYHWRGYSINKSGVYYDSLLTRSGCDSIYQLILTEAQSYELEETRSICDGEQLTWHGKTYTKEGTYYDYLQSVDGCDSTHILRLSNNPSYHFITEEGLVSGQSYTWRGNKYTAAGQYTEPYTTTEGCDSIYQLNLLSIRNKLYTYPTRYICEGKSIQWRGKTYSETGIYYDSLRSTVPDPDGVLRDSVFQLKLVVQKVFTDTQKVNICEGESYLWRGKKYNKTGLYSDPYTSMGLCDSTYYLNLTVGEIYSFTEQRTICDGESYFWHGFDYTKPGVYYDQNISVTGCDSTYQLVLKVAPKYYTLQTDTICEGESVVWRGKKYSKSGVYYDSLTTHLGCDSVLSLSLVVSKKYYFLTEDAFCKGDNYWWRGRAYNKDGVYFDSLISSCGCDSVYQLKLQEKQLFTDTTRATICEGEQYMWRNQSYTYTDMYYDRFVAHNGCDSVYVLILTVKPRYFSSQKAYICDGKQYLWHGRMYTKEGTYIDTIKATNGCDSVCELVLGMSNTYFYQETYDLCDDATYTWHNQTIRQAGKYTDPHLSSCNCDSVYEINVNLCHSFIHIDYDTICSGDTLIWRDSICTIDSIYFQWYTTQAGCDSTYELHLTVSPRYTLQDTLFLCEGTEIQWHNRTINQSGLYTDSLISSQRCDSIHHLYVLPAQNYLFEQSTIICYGDSFEWRGNNYSKSGTYYDSLFSAQQCDSIYILHLTKLPLFNQIDYDTICAGDTVFWRDIACAENNIYYQRYSTQMGCDSTYELHLIVNPRYDLRDSLYLCEGSVEQWHNHTIDQPGVYVDSLISSRQCDSTMTLFVLPASSYYNEQSATMCSDEIFNWHGRVITQSGTYYDSLQTTHLCDSVYTIHVEKAEMPVPVLPIDHLCADEDSLYISFQPNISEAVPYAIHFNDISLQYGFKDSIGVLMSGKIAIPLPSSPLGAFTVPNHYGGTIQLNGNSCLEQHSYDFDFDVLYSSSVVVQKFDDVLAVQNDRYNGGYVFTLFQWYADGKPIEHATASYYYGDGQLSANYYQVLLTRATDGVTMMTCPIYPKEHDKNQASMAAPRVCPTVVSVQAPQVFVYGEQITDCSLYNASGMNLHLQTITTPDGYTLNMPSQKGIYILGLKQANNTYYYKIQVK